MEIMTLILWSALVLGVFAIMFIVTYDFSEELPSINNLPSENIGLIKEVENSNG